MLRLGTRSQTRAIPVPAEIRELTDAPSLAQNRRMISKLAQGNPSDNSPVWILFWSDKLAKKLHRSSFHSKSFHF